MIVVLLLLAALALAPAEAAAQDAFTPCAAAECKPLATLGWEGDFRAERVEFTSKRTGARLRGTVLAPAGPARRGSLPGIVALPGSLWLSREESFHYAARELASHGYVVLGVDPQGTGRSATFGDPACSPDYAAAEPGYPSPCRGVPFQTLENFNDAAESGLDFLLGPDNPYADLLDRERIGLAGHSMAGVSVSVVQDRDPRVDAVVAWDALHSDRDGADQCGPSAYAIGGQVPEEGLDLRPVVPRVPALGLASNLECGTSYEDDSENRKRPYEHWRAAGLPTMLVVFQHTSHDEFAQADWTTPGSEHDAKLQRIEWYTRAWFDRHLKGDRDAVSRLLAAEIVGMPRDVMLHTRFRSAAFLPGDGVDCADLRICEDPGHGRFRGDP